MEKEYWYIVRTSDGHTFYTRAESDSDARRIYRQEHGISQNDHGNTPTGLAARCLNPDEAAVLESMVWLSKDIFAFIKGAKDIHIKIL